MSSMRSSKLCGFWTDLLRPSNKTLDRMNSSSSLLSGCFIVVACDELDAFDGGGAIVMLVMLCNLLQFLVWRKQKPVELPYRAEQSSLQRSDEVWTEDQCNIFSLNLRQTKC